MTYTQFVKDYIEKQDYGEPIFAEAACRVNKKTLECTRAYHDDPCWSTPKKPVEIPVERRDVFTRRKELWELEGETLSPEEKD